VRRLLGCASDILLGLGVAVTIIYVLVLAWGAFRWLVYQAMRSYGAVP
jgi:hypothetical protein